MTSQPGSQPRLNETFLDHIGHWLPDISAGANALRDLGFTVTPFSEQRQLDPETGAEVPAGAGNHCVMLRDGYLEFLTPLADTPIGRELRAGIARYVGVHIAAFAHSDATATSARLAAAGFPQRPVVNLQRAIGQADGTTPTARFSVARSQVGVIAEGRVQFLTHHTPQYLWQDRYVHHANTALGLAGLVFAVADVHADGARYERILDRPIDRSTCSTSELPGADGDSYCVFTLESGALALAEDSSASALFATNALPPSPAMLGYHLTCASVQTFADYAQAAGAAVRAVEDILQVTLPAALGGVVLVTPESTSLAQAMSKLAQARN